MKIYIPIIFALVSSGCSMFPETKDELLKTGNKSQTYCLTEAREIVEPRIQTYLAKCFHPKYVNVGSTGFLNNQNLTKLQENGKTEFTVFVPSGTGAGYFLNVEISNGQEKCKTNMSATAYNFMWERNFSNLLESAEGEDPSCPM
jgi:hypothetical protein